MTPEQEIKQLSTELKTGFEEFKKQNDARLKALEEKGHVPADIQEKVLATSGALTKIEEKIEAIKTAMARAPQGSPEMEAKELSRKSAKAVGQFLRKGMNGVGAEEKAAYLAEMKEHLGEDNPEYKALSVGSDPDGGYFVRPQVSAEITKKVFESSPMREISDGITISTSAFEEPYDGGEVGSGWVGELASRAATATSQFGMLRIETHELHATPKASQQLLDDSSVNMEQWLAGKVSEKFGRDEATAFITGNGVAKPRGIVSYANGTGHGQIEQLGAAGSGSAGITADNLIKLQDMLLEPFQPGALWLMQRATWTLCRLLKDGENRYMLTPGGNLLAGPTLELLGKPVKLAADMPTVAADSLSIAYGNFKMGYLVVDRVGVRVLRDPYTAKPYVQFYTTKRVGGGVRNFQAIKLLKLSA